MSLVSQVGAIDPASPGAVMHQPGSENQMGEKIRAINAEQIELICRQMIKPVLSKLGKTPLSEEAFIQGALPSVKQVVERSFAIPLEYMGKGLSFKLFASAPVGFLAETAAKNMINLDTTHIPCGYRVSLDLDKRLTLQRGELTFVLTELSGETTISQKAFTIKELEKMGT